MTSSNFMLVFAMAIAITCLSFTPAAYASRIRREDGIMRGYINSAVAFHLVTACVSVVAACAALVVLLIALSIFDPLGQALAAEVYYQSVFILNSIPRAVSFCCGIVLASAVVNGSYDSIVRRLDGRWAFAAFAAFTSLIAVSFVISFLAPPEVYGNFLISMIPFLGSFMASIYAGSVDNISIWYSLLWTFTSAAVSVAYLYIVLNGINE